MRDAGQAGAAKRWFIASWVVLCAVKLALAWRLPLFVDEAFYWQEGRHPAWAYSDLPGLTAWLAHLGDALAPAKSIGLRLPFLAIGALVPWLVVAMTRREFGERAGWQAGVLALLLPLAGTMGLLALPDVPLLLASALCLDAGLRLLRRVDALAAGELALGLAIGGLTHYRFVAVIAVGFIALLALREGRAALRDGRVWLAVLAGALAWLPLLLWNLGHADAGLRFQLVDRHPWSFSGGEGLWLGVVQLLLATPLLLVAMALGVRRAFAGAQPAARYLALTGVGIVLGFFVLGFFADRERVSFHWPLPGHLALLPLVSLVIAGWTRGWRRATFGVALLGLLGALAYYALALVPTSTHGVWREERPVHFAGWRQLAAAVDEQLREMPAGTGVVVGNFRIGAQLGHLRNHPDIPVLVHPLNEKHGRAVQLATWGLLRERLDRGPALLVVAATDVKFREQLAYFRQLCERVGPLPPPHELAVDGGRQRFLLFRLPAVRGEQACVTPALAHVDVPAEGATVGRRFMVSAWAVKDVAGVRRLEVLLDGQPVAVARRAGSNPWVADVFLGGRSRDPALPRMQFEAEVDARGFAPGPHWLGLRATGGDGAVETSRERVVVLR